MLALKAFLGWMLILLCAVINGGLREGFLVPQLGPAAGLAVSGLFLVACILLVSIALVPWFGALDVLRCLWIGLLWLSLTLSFEFGFGRLVQHKSWSQLLEAYTFHEGNLWPVVLVFTLFAPLLARRLRGSLRGMAK